jgi:two-component sensor histidine kinase
MANYNVDGSIRSASRLAALKRTALLDTPSEPFFDRVTGLAARLLNTNTALLSLVDGDRQFFKSECGLPYPYAQTRQTPLSHSFCKHVVSTNETLVIRDSRSNPLVERNAAVTDLGVLAYLGEPVRSGDGEVLGSLCVIANVVRDWSADDIVVIGELARIVEHEIHVREHARVVGVVAEENALLAQEYHHRVKNALAVSAALVNLSARDATSIHDLVQKTSGRLLALAGAHDSLITMSDDVDLQELAARLLLPYVPLNATADVSGPAVKLAHAQVTPICLFLHELATNSAKYGAFARNGKAEVRWTNEDGGVHLHWNELLPQKSQPSPAGFGSKLLEVAARQLKGRMSSTWTDDGLLVTLEFQTVRQCG